MCCGSRGEWSVSWNLAEKGGKRGTMFGRETLCIAQCFKKEDKDGGAASVADDEVPAAVDEPSIPSPTPPTPPPQPSQDQPSTSQDKIAQALEIIKLKQRVKKLERRNKVSKLRRLKKGRTIADMNADKDVTLKDDVVVAKDVQDAEIKESFLLFFKLE
nr:hypothetical protein [Tanacetum cinerariifolium]